MQRFKRWRLKAKVGSASDYLQESRPRLESTPVAGDGVVPDQIHDYLLQAAIRAPSGDNCQPWRFIQHGDDLHLTVDPDADRSFFNVAQTASLISCGAATENLVLAASRFGLAASVSISEAGGTAQVKVALSPADVDEDPLQRFVWERHTNRTLYDRSPLTVDHREKILEAIEPFDGAELVLLSEPEQIGEAGRLVAGIDRIRSDRRDLHTHLMRMIRFSRHEALDRRDGFFLKNLEAGRAGEWFIRCTRPWPVMRLLNQMGMGRLISRISHQGICSASAVGLLKVPTFRPRDLIAGGRAVERIWLTVTRLGLSFQPMTAATLFWLRWQMGGRADFSAAHRRLLTELWPVYRRLFAVDREEEGHVMLFRIGRGRPVSCRTLRKPPAEFRLPWHFGYPAL